MNVIEKVTIRDTFRAWVPRVISTSPALGVFLAILTWPYSIAAMTPSASPAGFQADLYMALVDRLHFGTQVIFTYGPLGFLGLPAFYYRAPAAAAFVVTFALYAAIATALVAVVRQVLNVWLAMLVAYFCTDVVISFIFPQDESELAFSLVALLCLRLYAGYQHEEIVTRYWVCVGSLASLLTLVKVSTGAAAVVLVLLAAAIAARRRADVLAVTISAFITWTAGWFLSGNDVGNIPSYVRGAYEESAGYGPAMQLEVHGLLFHYWLAAAIVLVLLALILYSTRGWTSACRIAAPVTAFAAEVLLFREGFVRHDVHDLIFASGSVVLVAAVGLIATDTRTRQMGIVALLFATLVVFRFAGDVPFSQFDPVASVRNAFDVSTTLIFAKDSANEVSAGRQQLAKYFQIPTSMVSAARGDTVAIEPFDDGALWAYPLLKPDPEPAIQNYNAYTSGLDHLDVAWLRGSTAPTWILNQPPFAPDFRNPSWEPPSFEFVTECDYRESQVTPTWEMLERTADRCGPLHRLATVDTSFGRWVKTPTAAPDDAVVASMSIQLPLAWHLENALLKPGVITAYVNAGSTSYRFIDGTASDLHLMTVARNLGYSAEFAPASVSSIKFELAGASSQLRIAITYYEVSFANPRSS